MSQTPNDQVGIGVIGTGWWSSQFHIPAVIANPLARLASIADPDPDRLRASKDAFQAPQAVASHAELLRNPSVHAVVIATPHASHFELARDALTAGKHVLVEKPITLDVAQADELRRLAKAKGLALTIGHTYHHTRHAQRARDVVNGGAIGDVRLVSALFASMVTAYYRGQPDEYDAVFSFPVVGPNPATYSDPALSGGGQGWTQVTHLMDMVFWVTGLEPARVFARMNNEGLPVDLVDSFSMQFSNGALCAGSSTGQLLPGQQQQQEIRYYGTEGYLLQELINGQLRIVYNSGDIEELPPLTASEVYPAHAPVDWLVEIASGSVPVPADSADSSVATVRFLDAAYRSATSGRDEGVR
jgi:predicted dehydrogenase